MILLPSPDLSYIIGVVLGDGNLDGYKQLHKGKYSSHLSSRYMIKLRVKDFEFVKAFQQAIEKVTGRSPKIWRMKDGKYSVDVSCKPLFLLLKQGLSQLRQYIDLHPEGFIRGFFDSEGSAHRRKPYIKRVVIKAKTYFVHDNNSSVVIQFNNTNRELLDLVRYYLIKLGIFPAPKFYEQKPGSVVINGVPSKRIKTCYKLCIYRKESTKKFMSIIGTSISRKRLVD